MDSRPSIWAVIWLAGLAVSGCGFGERFTTASPSARAGGGSADAGSAGSPPGSGGATAGSGQGGGFRGTSEGSSAGGEAVAGGGGVAGSAGGASVGTAGTDSAPPLLVDVPKRYAKAICEAVEGCYPGLARIVFGANDCELYVEQQIENAQLPGMKESVEAGTMQYSPGELETCMNALSSKGCAFDAREYIPECEKAFSGTRASGEDCSVDVECEGDLYCKVDGACPGTCSPRETVNASCRGNGDCEAGLVCNQGGVCTKKIPFGEEACGNGDTCVPGTLCTGVNASQNTLGRCEKFETIFARSDGQACDFDNNDLCALDLSCTAELDTSAEQGVLLTCGQRAPSGNACRPAVPDPCPRDKYCDGVSLTEPIDLTGSCRPLPTGGQACAPSMGFGKVCAEGHVCIDGTCARLGTNGESCDSPAECFSGLCSDKKCVPLQVCQFNSAG